MTGWFNWAFNVFPHLQLALNNIYAKMGGKWNREQHIYINNAIQSNLVWAINHIKAFNSIHILKSIAWTPSIANFVIYCDTCPEGMGFLYPISKDGYYAPTPTNVPSNVIFYFECLCVLSALADVQTKAPHGSKILIYTDNANTVDIFHTLHCLPAYNHLLQRAVDIIMAKDFSLCVLHVPGDQNVVADTLSHVQFSVALTKEPNLNLFTFHPPSLVGSTKWFTVIDTLDSLSGRPGLETSYSEKDQLLLDMP